MNQRDDLDRMLGTWLDDPLTLPAPGYLSEVLDQTRQMRQRPSWASLERWLPMSMTLRRSFVPMPAVLAMLGLLIVLAILASLSLVPLLAGALGPTGVVSPAGLIAFDRDGDIYVAEPEPGATPRSIVSGPDEDVGPLWSPDGRRLLFFRVTPEGETPMLTDAAGSEPVALVDTPLPVSNWVDWTSDSSALVFSVDPSLVPASQPSGLVMLPIDGSVERIPVEAEVHQHAFPAPRPVSGDTIELLYRSSSDPEAAQLRVAELTPDGALVRDGPVLGVDDIDGVRTAGYGNQFDFEQSTWSPTGERFAYNTLNDVAAAQDGNGMRVHVARYSAGANQAGLADTLVEFDPMSDDEGFPVWSPDGSRVAFQAYDGAEARLVIMPVPVEGPVDASAAVVSEAFTTGDLGWLLQETDYGPGLRYAWAPDGSSLVLMNGAVRPQAPAQRMDATTGELVPLGWSSPSWPSWQPKATD